MNLDFPKVIFGTSSLGNLYTALSFEKKMQIVSKIVEHSIGPVVFDCAGKYGAGHALESLSKCLETLDVNPANVIISNKLGWYRTELTTPEPTFEPGVWCDIKHDAVQKISYQGIIECFEQGNMLLGKYKPQLLSVHDPDEYLANAETIEEQEKLFQDILDAYRALYDLKKEHNILIGVGAKSWKSIQRISRQINLDWVMFANSMTIKNHPQELLDFMEELRVKGVKIINSAVFQAGFLTGGEYYDYKIIKADTEENKAIFKWREDFFEICEQFGVTPASACVQFALSVPGVTSVALNTNNPERIEENVKIAYEKLPAMFWLTMKQKGLIANDYKLPEYA
jgi:D-threo-aldose 1-dehydrogenase